MLITSRANEKVKQIKRLFRRREREETGLFFAEGFQLVSEAIQMGAGIESLIAAPELLGKEEMEFVERHRDIPSLQVTAQVLQSISPKDAHQGMAAVVRQRWERMEEVRPGQESCWVALDRIQHPGSLGTILRVSDAVGGAGVILVGDSTDPYDPTAVRASLGAVFSQRLVKASFEEFAAWKREHGAFVVGTSPAAATDYRAVSYPRPVVLLLGSERRGLSEEEQAVCDVVVRIPMVGRVDSHHVAVAAAVVLYEILHQRQAEAQEGIGRALTGRSR
jgi:TrmH family RNA methyltransferase